MGTQRQFSIKTTPQWLNDWLLYAMVTYQTQAQEHLFTLFNPVTILYNASNLKPQHEKGLTVVLLGNGKHNVDDIKGMHTTWNDRAKVK